MTSPRHPQLMDPITDPEEYIASSIYWYPSIFPTRTDVLDHLFLCNGNGYEWNSDGEIRSVFAHLPVRDNTPLDYYDDEISKYEARGFDDIVEDLVKERSNLIRIQVEHRELARTYGPVRMTEMGKARTVTSRDLGWTLLGRRPAWGNPIWLPVIVEVEHLFRDILVEQGTLW